MMAKVTLKTLAKMKAEGRRISMLTAYDASFAHLLDKAGLETILVGDSLGNVIQGQRTTLPVTLDHMAYHTACVARGTERALLIADMPALTYVDRVQAARNARQLLAAGAEMVKLEGAGPIVDVIEFLAGSGVSVCAHLGLTPQSVHKLGGFRVQGRDEDAADRLKRDAAAVAEAGADLLILECVPAALGAEITQLLSIPVIGIGAGPDCDGQVLVLYDALGLGSGHTARFVRNFCADGASVQAGIDGYVAAVRSGEYPAPEHCY